MLPSRCTQNTLFHIDYGTPLLANRSTDYRTSTAKNHDFMPQIPQDFDCRAKAHLKKELLERDVSIRNEYVSTYKKNYLEKYTREKEGAQNTTARSCESLQCIRSVQEKMFQHPPPPKNMPVSEMKDCYPQHYYQPKRDPVYQANCQMPEVFRPLQPGINPATKGYHKLLDIYLTENRANYVQYSPDKLDEAQQDLPTIYNTSGKHKGLKQELPNKLTGNPMMYDKMVIKNEVPNRFLSNATKRVPHSGMSSEYQSKYPNPTQTEFYPYLIENGVYCEDSLSSTGNPWQDLCPPAIYCTEKCHIGTGWGVRCVVDVNKPLKTKLPPHSTECCTKLE